MTTSASSWRVVVVVAGLLGIASFFAVRAAYKSSKLETKVEQLNADLALARRDNAERGRLELALGNSEGRRRACALELLGLRRRLAARDARAVGGTRDAGPLAVSGADAAPDRSPEDGIAEDEYPPWKLGGSIEARMERTLDALNLSEGQREPVEKTLNAAVSELQQLGAGLARGELKPEAFRDRFWALYDSTDDELSRVLDVTQYEVFNQVRAELLASLGPWFTDFLDTGDRTRQPVLFDPEAEAAARR
jgi:hypothetical protein